MRCFEQAVWKILSDDFKRAFAYSSFFMIIGRTFCGLFCKDFALHPRWHAMHCMKMYAHFWVHARWYINALNQYYTPFQQRMMSFSSTLSLVPYTVCTHIYVHKCVIWINDVYSHQCSTENPYDGNLWSEYASLNSGAVVEYYSMNSQIACNKWTLKSRERWEEIGR